MTKVTLVCLWMLILSAPAMAGALTVEEIKDPEAVSFLCGLDDYRYFINSYHYDVSFRCLLSREADPAHRGGVFCQNEKPYVFIRCQGKKAVFPLPRACRWLYGRNQYGAGEAEPTPGETTFTLEKHGYCAGEGAPVKPSEIVFKIDARGPEIILISQEYYDISHPEFATPEIPVTPTSNEYICAFENALLEHAYVDDSHTIRFIVGNFNLPSLIVRHHESNWHSLIVAISENEEPYRKKAFLIREGASYWLFWELIRGEQLPQRDPDTGKYSFTVCNITDLGLVNGQRESEQRAVRIQVGMDGMEVQESVLKE